MLVLVLVLVSALVDEFEGVKHAGRECVVSKYVVSKYFTKDGMPNTLRCESVSEVSKFKYVQ